MGSTTDGAASVTNTMLPSADCCPVEVSTVQRQKSTVCLDIQEIFVVTFKHCVV